MSGDNSPEAGFYVAATAPPLLESMKQAYQTVAVAIATASESTGRAKPQHHISETPSPWCHMTLRITL